MQSGGEKHLSANQTLGDFQHEVVAFLEKHAKRKVVDTAEASGRWGVGDDDVSLYEDTSGEEARTALEEAKHWRATRFDAGLGWIIGPTEYGGRDLSREFERQYLSLERAYKVPPGHFFDPSLGMVAPTILAHASDEIRKRYLPAMYRGDLIGCQLFSEPAAGSDVAGLRCRAKLSGNSWEVTGQKVWTSGAQYSDIGEVLCRTDPSQPKHGGLTMFLVDMHGPGVEVRPLRQMTGGSAFNEVFFDGAVIGDDHRLGEVNDGWRVALTTLRNERGSIGASSHGGRARGIGDASRLIELAQHLGVADDPLVRSEIARIFTGFAVARWTNQRALAKIRTGEAPGAELSGGKLALTRNIQAVADFVSRVLGPRVIADTGEWGTYAWSQFVLGVPGSRIAGGTDEIQRNTIAEQVLGLPREQQSDRGVPFEQLVLS